MGSFSAMGSFVSIACLYRRWEDSFGILGEIEDLHSQLGGSKSISEERRVNSSRDMCNIREKAMRAPPFSNSFTYLCHGHPHIRFPQNMVSLYDMHMHLKPDDKIASIFLSAAPKM